MIFVLSVVKEVHALHNREDVIWCAGLFEGEGTITVSKIPSGNIYPRIKIKMCDKDALDKFASTFGLKVQSVQKDKSWQTHWKEAWYTDVCGVKAIAILYMLYPWLGLRRKARADEVIDMWKKNITS